MADSVYTNPLPEDVPNPDETKRKGRVARALVPVHTAVDYTVDGDDELVVVTVAGKTVTLPDAATVAGLKFAVVSVAGTTTVATVAGNISGASTYALTAAYAAKTFYSDGTNYFAV